LKLKRNDLVNDFELIVKQEIKNHNDAVLASNIAVNKLNELIEKEVKELKGKCNFLLSEHSEMERGLDNFQISYSVLYDKISKLEIDSSNLYDRNYKEIQVIDKSVETVHRNEKTLEKEMDNLRSEFRNFKNEIDELKKVHIQQIDRMKIDFPKELKRLKNEILSRPL